MGFGEKLRLQIKTILCFYDSQDFMGEDGEELMLCWRVEVVYAVII